MTRRHGKIVEAAKKLKDGTSFPGWLEKQLVDKIKNCLKIARKAGGVVHTPSMKGRGRKQVIDEQMEVRLLDTFLELDKYGVTVTPEFACSFVYNSFSERSDYMAQFKSWRHVNENTSRPTRGWYDKIVDRCQNRYGRKEVVKALIKYQKLSRLAHFNSAQYNQW
jgi:hypothetical protein